LTISQDIGWLLLRGVALSFLVSITLLPALLLTFEGKLTWKTLNLENIVANIAASVEKAVTPLCSVTHRTNFWGSGVAAAQKSLTPTMCSYQASLRV